MVNMLSTNEPLVWHIEWGHDFNLIVDAGFYPDDGPFGMDAMVSWLTEQGFAYVSARYVGQN